MFKTTVQAGYRRSSKRLSVVPELVDPRQDGDGPVPDVAGVVHLPALHLHLGVLQPQRDVAVVHVQRSLVDGARPEGGGAAVRGGGGAGTHVGPRHIVYLDPYLKISFRLSSHCAYLIQLLMTVRFFLMLSSKPWMKKYGFSNNIYIF